MSSGYRPTYREYKPSNEVDPVRYRQFVSTRPTEYRPTNEPYVYKPYKPTHVGIYGEQQRPRNIRQRPTSGPKLAPPKRTTRELRTYGSYRNPMGPDIKVHEHTGPKYNVEPYRLPSNKPIQAYQPYIPYEDPLRKETGYKSDHIGVYKGSVDYKLTEENNLAMRHWRNDFVDDTISAKQSKENREQKYKPMTERKRTPEPKPAREKTPEPRIYEERSKTPGQKQTRPVVAPILVPPSPVKKYFKTQPTQTQPIPTKTSGTQFEKNKTNSTSMQTMTPLPDQRAVPVPVVTPAGKRPTRSASMQTSPVLEPVQRSPVKTRPKESPEDMYYEQRRTPSPEVVPLVFAGNPRVQSKSPKQTPLQVRESPKPNTPTYDSPTRPRSNEAKTASVAPIVYASHAPSPPEQKSQRRTTPPKYDSPELRRESEVPVNNYKSPVAQGSSEYKKAPQVYDQPTVPKPTPDKAVPYAYMPQEVHATEPNVKSRPQQIFPVHEPVKSSLPPEVTACLEAYDSAHVVSD